MCKLTIFSPSAPLTSSSHALGPCPPPQYMTYMHLGHDHLGLGTWSSLKETGSPFHSLHTALHLGVVPCGVVFAGLSCLGIHVAESS